MVTTQRWLPTLLVVLLGLGGSAYLFFGKPSPRPVSPPEPLLPVVDVIEVFPQRVAVAVRTQGTVQPRRQIDLVAQVGGVVVAVGEHFAAGGFFDEGEVLAKLDAVDYRLRLIRARAAVAEARQVLAQEQGRARQAKREWRDLKDRDANDLFLRKPQLAAAQAAVAAAGADVEQAELDLARTAIEAPFAGRIMETYVDRGQFVSPGEPVARIHATSAVEVRLPLTDRQVGGLELDLIYRSSQGGQTVPVPVSLRAVFGGNPWEWQGVIRRTDAGIDPQSRVIYAVAEVADPFGLSAAGDRPPLLIGQFVEAEIAGRELEGVLRVPRQALRSRRLLWVVDPEQRLQLLPVVVLERGESEVLLQVDAATSLRVVTSSLPQVIPGMRVRPRAAAEGAPTWSE